MAKEEEYDKLPDKGAAKEFYAKYEPKEILGRQKWIKNKLFVISLIKHYRGISSTVRRCIEKETGIEYAAKIIDLSCSDPNEGSTLDATKQEIAILRHVAGHPYISKYKENLRH